MILSGIARIVRLPNLLIIILTQVLIRYAILLPLLYRENIDQASPLWDFLLLVLVTVLIAAGGYVINDYFDVKIDRINRPEKQVVGMTVTPRGAILLHAILNSVAILLGFYLSWRLRALTFGLIFPLISAILWIYSAKYKRMLFWGNFIVSGLTAFVILIAWLFEFFWMRLHPEAFASALPVFRAVNLVVCGYALFAFLVSMVREIIKDMEDTEGDSALGCMTLPLALGMPKTRIISGALVLLTMILMGYSQLILWRMELRMVFWYFMATVQVGALYLLIRLVSAKEKTQFHALSNLCKIIMLAGILSMEIIYLNA